MTTDEKVELLVQALGETENALENIIEGCLRLAHRIEVLEQAQKQGFNQLKGGTNAEL